ncbi:hypothetical protein EBI_26635 [Enterocytozoon bieneusi H348]|nr:hypothetical protein EBI_26635 [Enterocytozoon bieneusi H348]|eukprot:XP_002651287.1 hypothetical protein EBI_26635 [Enterocytozoon bieneusi H348]
MYIFFCLQQNKPRCEVRQYFIMLRGRVPIPPQTREIQDQVFGTY